MQTAYRTLNVSVMENNGIIYIYLDKEQPEYQGNLYIIARLKLRLF